MVSGLASQEASSVVESWATDGLRRRIPFFIRGQETDVPYEQPIWAANRPAWASVSSRIGVRLCRLGRWSVMG